METIVQPTGTSKAMLWTGRVISALPILMMMGGGIAMFFNPAMMQEGMKHLGYPEQHARAFLILEIGCAIVYLIPQTAVLGAILITGYLGGATASHIRIGESPAMAIIVGVLVWLGLLLRDARIRALLPLRMKVVPS